MKILRDECVTRKAKALLTQWDVHTVPEMGFSGLKNGKLLRAAEEQGFDILLTIDKNIDSQQNIRKHKICLVVLNVLKSNISYIEQLLPEFISKMENFEKGKTYVIDDPIR